MNEDQLEQSVGAGVMLMLIDVTDAMADAGASAMTRSREYRMMDAC